MSRSAARTLEIFEAFGNRLTPLTLSELARQLSIPISTCRLITQTLISRGYLYSLSEQKRFYPTGRIHSISARIDLHNSVVTAFRPLLSMLRDLTGETILLAKADGDKARYLDVLDGTHAVRFSRIPGDVAPLHSSAVGKALLGGRMHEELVDYLRTLDLQKFTSRTLTTAEDLLADLTEGRKRGFQVSDGENVPEAMGVGLCVKAHSGDFAVAIAGPHMRLQPRLEAYASLLIEHMSQMTGRD